MSNTPASIFELGQMIPEVHHYLDLWQHGRLDWNTCLLEMHKALVQRCIELDDKWNVGLDISEKMFAISENCQPQSYAQARLFEYNKLEQQQNVIRCIYIVANMLHHLIDFAKRTVENRHISQIMCYKDGRREFHYSDGHVEAWENDGQLLNFELPSQAGECLEPQKLDIS
ncbi:MAG: hypothetical protein IM526_02430 [Microcystis sp. M38BS1]|uniref:hypothetical protein n=1 Tax=Microcystis sp. M38BS1 TaxID=2771188 RepID=UPI0031FC97AC|nr:hypothetical protein [Microcystis sp. M38BS1]MCA6582514.1 hypothetical protein [Pseudanabaena sp. M34BS1SP1A06MG]